MLEVPALKLRFVELVKLIGVPPLSVTALLPKVIERVCALLEIKEEAVTLKFPVLKDPLVTVNEELPILTALPRVHPQPTPFILVALFKVTPLVVNVLPVVEPERIMLPEKLLDKPVAGSVTLP